MQWENSTMSESNWRSPEAYAMLQGAEITDFAWEFLRRNNEYREDHLKLESSGPVVDVSRNFRQRWGLSFRG